MNQTKSVNIQMDIEKLSKMLGSQQYENAYSFIQEAAQNGIDSHRTINSSENIIVYLGKGKYYSDFVIRFRDFGKSFETKEDFEQKVCTLLYSDKSAVKTNDDNEVMGKWGIGSISPARYTASNKKDKTFKYVVFKNGKAFTATLEEQDGKGLTYFFSNYTATTEKDGVLLEVPFNPQVGNLEDLFRNLKTKLSYFENISFSFDNSLLSDFSFSYKADLISLNKNEIIKGEHFSMSSFNTYNHMHLIIDQYIYPIDFHHLGIDPIGLPIGLNFKMNDGLEPNVTRERVFLTAEYKKIVKDKIALAKNEIKERFEKEYSDLDDLKKYMDNLDDGFFCFKELPTEPISLSHISSNAFFTYKGKDLRKEVKAIRSIFNAKFNTKYQVLNGSIRDIEGTWRAKGFEIYSNYIILDDGVRMKQNEKDKLRSSYGNYYLLIERKKGVLNTMMKYCGSSSSELREIYKKTGENIWRTPVENIKFFLNELETSGVIKRKSQISFPPAIKRVKKVKNPLEEGEVLFKKADPTVGSRTHLHCAFNDFVLSTSKMSSHPKFIYYGTKDDISTLDKLAYSFHNFTFAYVNQKAKKFLDENKFQNIKHFSKFMDIDFPAIKKYVTAIQIKESKILKDPYLQILMEEILGEDSKKNLVELQSYVNSVSYVNSSIGEEIIELAKEKNLYDYKTKAKLDTVIADYEKVKDYEDLGVILTSYKNKNESKIIVNLIANQMKRDHYRINPKFYKIKNEKKEKLNENEDKE